MNIDDEVQLKKFNFKYLKIYFHLFLLILEYADLMFANHKEHFLIQKHSQKIH